MASQGDVEVWYAHPVYARYWQHYQQAMNWWQRHKQAYSKALEVGHFQALYSMCPSTMQRYSDWHADKSWRNNHRDGTTGREENSEMEESSDESQIECDVNNMDISEELRQYFAQTERHKQELNYSEELMDESLRGARLIIPECPQCHAVSVHCPSVLHIKPA